MKTKLVKFPVVNRNTVFTVTTDTDTFESVVLANSREVGRYKTHRQAMRRADGLLRKVMKGGK